MKALYLYNNEIENIDNLYCCANLTQLHLQHNKIRKIEGLSNLIHLKKLYLDYNRISILEGLTFQCNLEELSISNQDLDESTTFLFDIDTLNTLSVLLNIFHKYRIVY